MQTPSSFHHQEGYRYEPRRTFTPKFLNDFGGEVFDDVESEFDSVLWDVFFQMELQAFDIMDRCCFLHFFIVEVEYADLSRLETLSALVRIIWFCLH